jgi:hypothetical protein
VYVKEKNEMVDGKFYSLFKSLPTALTPKEDKEPGIYENTYKIFNALKDDGTCSKKWRGEVR